MPFPWGVGPLPCRQRPGPQGRSRATKETDMNWKKFLLTLAIILGASLPMFAQTAITFPTLPDGGDWVTALTAIFISAAGLGLGILGLRLVIRMIKAGLKR